MSREVLVPLVLLVLLVLLLAGCACAQPRGDLKRVWQNISEENRELVDTSALYYAGELRKL